MKPSALAAMCTMTFRGVVMRVDLRWRQSSSSDNHRSLTVRPTRARLDESLKPALGRTVRANRLARTFVQILKHLQGTRRDRTVDDGPPSCMAGASPHTRPPP